ncbi:MAG: choice-of-anchor tandem repeat GloVer-containing protein [Candidatus Sulfotelmatobacter sp.]
MLQSFTELHDGGEPGAGLVFDSSGNLFGSADFGGNGNLGTVWELSPTAHGPWKLTQLYSFGDGTTGSRPNSGVIIDPSGNLYGTAQQGGEFDRGTVFELSPSDSRKSN